jgi:type-F conjugative transfer system pilin assembly protein TrbC
MPRNSSASRRDLSNRVWIALALFLFGAYAAHAVAQPAAPSFPASADEAGEKAASAMEKAMTQARRMQAANLRESHKPGFDLNEMSRTQGVDVAAIAAKYEELKRKGRPDTPELKVFISTSMPKQALAALGRQAKTVGAVLVLRGLRGRLDEPGALQRTLEAMAPAAETGAQILIDPESFTRYGITAVPTFVLANDKVEEECAENSCEASAYSLVGDVSLDYALRHWVDQGGEAGRRAEVFVKRLERTDSGS